MNLLHIYSSPARQPSISSQISDRIVDALRLVMPSLKVSRRNLEADPLPSQIPLRPGPATHAAERRERQLGADVLSEFLKAEVIVIGAPSHDPAVARQLRAWIDRVIVAGKSLDLGAEGIRGLTSGKKVIVASSSGSDEKDASAGFQETFLRAELGFIGITNVEFVRTATPAPKETRKRAFRAAPIRRLEPTIAA